MLAKYVTVGDMQTSQAALRLKKKKKRKTVPLPATQHKNISQNVVICGKRRMCLLATCYSSILSLNMSKNQIF